MDFGWFLHLVQLCKLRGDQQMNQMENNVKWNTWARV